FDRTPNVLITVWQRLSAEWQTIHWRANQPAPFQFGHLARQGADRPAFAKRRKRCPSTCATVEEHRPRKPTPGPRRSLGRPPRAAEGTAAAPPVRNSRTPLHPIEVSGWGPARKAVRRANRTGHSQPGPSPSTAHAAIDDRSVLLPHSTEEDVVLRIGSGFSVRTPLGNENGTRGHQFEIAEEILDPLRRPGHRWVAAGRVQVFQGLHLFRPSRIRGVRDRQVAPGGQ